MVISFSFGVLDNPRGQYKQNIICIYIDYLKKESGSLVFSKFYKTQITRFNELGYVVRLADTMVYGGGALAPSRHLGGWNSGKWVECSGCRPRAPMKCAFPIAAFFLSSCVFSRLKKELCPEKNNELVLLAISTPKSHSPWVHGYQCAPFQPMYAVFLLARGVCVP